MLIRFLNWLEKLETRKQCANRKRLLKKLNDCMRCNQQANPYIGQRHVKLEFLRYNFNNRT
mgnify:CR=1 FL=1